MPQGVARAGHLVDAFLSTFPTARLWRGGRPNNGLLTGGDGPCTASFSDPRERWGWTRPMRCQPTTWRGESLCSTFGEV